MRKLYYVFLCGLLAACATPPEQRSKPKTAAELAATQLPGTAAEERSLPVISSLPQPATAPAPKQVNNDGSLPTLPHYKAPSVKAPKANKQTQIALDFEQIPLRELLQMIADTLQISMVIDPSIGEKITIRTAPGKMLQDKDLWPLLQLVLRDNNISLEQRGSIYHLKKEQANLPGEIGRISSRLAQSDSPFVLQITPLRYIALEAALTTLQPLVEPEGRIISVPNLNLLGIISTPDKLKRINQLISLVDADPFVHRGMRLFRLQNSKASEAKADLDKILKAIEGQTPSYEIIDLERINGLLVVAPPRRGFREVERWIDILDEENEAGGEQVFIYRVRNLKATELASTLNDVFEKKDKDEVLPNRNKKDDKANKETPQQALTPKPVINTNNNAAPTVSAELKVTIVADEATNALLVRATPKDYRQLLETISLLDTVPKEVMINVVIAEVELTEQHQFGIDWNRLFGSGRSFVGSNFKIPDSASVDANGVISRSDNGLVLSYVTDKISAVLNMLSTDGHVELLSRPSLLVRDNQEASINVGADEPTITRINQTQTGSTINNLTTSNEVQYRKTGIILKVKPQINDDGIINMDVRQEVSDIGTLRTQEQLPSFRERVIETSLVVKDGNAIVMGGLIQTSWDNNFEGLPGLQDIPVAGRLFQSENVEKVRTELVVIIVPQIIHPDADNRSYVRQFRDRMTRVKRLMDEDDTPIVFYDEPVVPEALNAAQPQPGQ